VAGARGGFGGGHGKKIKKMYSFFNLCTLLFKLCIKEGGDGERKKMLSDM
jgi:hypothetical protein